MTDPLSDVGDSMMAGGGVGAAAMAALAAEPDLDTEVATLLLESELDDSPSVTVTLAREYVWGPGDNGVDELLVQYDANRAPTWALQDAGLDVVALCDLGGGSGSARVLWQGVYDAYGSVLSAESPQAHAALHAGHKGLFFDRLDAGILTYGVETPRLAAGSRLLGHVRNRACLPGLGRWAQKDPNASGLTLVNSLKFAGDGQTASITIFDLNNMYGDGGNLYSYVGSNPTTQHDPLGLFIYGIGPTDTLMMAFEVGQIAYSLMRTYAEDLDFDAEWAMDWSQGDDLHSRSGVWSSLSDLDEEGYGDGTGPAMAGVVRTMGKVVGRFGTVGYRVWEKHHILPRYIAKWLNHGVSKFLAELPPTLHRAAKVGYHRGLDLALRAKGIPPMTHPRPGPKWAAFVKSAGSVENAKAIVSKTIKDFTDKFCGQHGIPSWSKFADGAW